MRNLLGAFTIVLLLAAVGFAQTEKQKAKLGDEVKTVLNTQVAAWNSGDLDGFMRGYWRSPELVFVSGANVTRGWQPTLDRYKKSYPTREKMGVLSFSDLAVEILSKDAAVVLGTWALKREADNPGGKFTLIFRRFKDGWRIIHDHTS